MSSKTPEIRFDRFTDDWEQRKLGEQLNLLKDGTHGSHKDVDEGIYLLSAKNIKKNQIIINEKNDRKISKTEFASIHKNFSLKKGDVLLTVVGSIGESAIIEDPYGITFQRSVAYLRPNGNLTSQFLLTTIKSFKFQVELKKRQVISAQPGIYLGDLAVIPIQVPPTSEQILIGSFFKHLDYTVALHQRQLENLEKSKKAFLQKMFPKNGETVPEIRFGGFADDWEQRKLEEISDKITEKNKNNDFSETLTNSAKYGIVSQRDFFDKDISNIKNLNTYYIVRENDFVYNPRISNFAPVGPIKRNKLGRTGVMSPLYYVFRTYKVNENYLEHYFNTTRWHKFMKVNGDSGARADRFAIKDTLFKTMPIPYPCFEEQKKIGLFLKQLDKTVDLHQRQLENLKQIKKSLLQKMFV